MSQPAKGKSPIDRKKVGIPNGAEDNSIQKRILTGDFCLPGKTSSETIAAYRSWQKARRIDGQHIERWYRTVRSSELY